MPTDALISQSIPSLINGVSQQPSNQRLPSQAEAQDNVLSAVADGATVRPPSEHVALLTGSFTSVPLGGVKIHTINRGDGQQFAVVLEDQDVNVYDLSDGTEVTVNDNAAGTPGAYTYLDFNTGTTTAEEAFEAVTVADYTFLVNKTVTAAMSGVPSTDRENAHEFLLHVKTTAPTGGATIITVNINSLPVSSTGTPNDTDALTGAVMTALTGAATGTNAVGTTHLDWKFTRAANQNTIYGYQFQNTGTLQDIESSDDYGDTLHNLYATGTGGEPPQAERFSDLPARGHGDFTIMVSGDDGSNEDNYWVKYDDQERIWKETVKPGLDDAFDGDTLPHALIYNSGTGQFSFEPVTWLNRLVGDEDSAAEPSFIGKTISDVLVHKNRLVFVSDENVIAGESGEFFNFWPTTVTTLLDSDPFDVAGTGNTVAIWDYAVPYRGNLTLFSTTGNVIGELTGSRDEPLTIKNARIEDRANYAMSGVRPVAAADQVYFLTDRGGATAVYAYIEADVDLYRADEVTSHIQSYLPTSMVRMTASKAENMLCFLSKDTTEDHRIYVYRYHFIGNEQVMSSWSSWTFDSSAIVLSAEWIESTLYLLIKRQDGIHLEKIDLGKTDEDEGAYPNSLGYRIHLDSLLVLTGSYDVGTGETTWTIPYDQATNGGTYRIIKGGAWGSARGSSIVVKDASVDLSITADGDHSAQEVYIGREFTWSYQLSEIHVRDSQGQTNRGRIGGRLQLRTGRVVYKNTGTFDVEITSEEDSDTYSETFTSQFLNQAIFGPTGLDDGVFEFHIGGDSRNVRITFTGTSFLPAQLSSVEWVGRFIQRSDQA